MANWFEDLTKTMADDKLPRRQAIRRITGTLAGAALASLISGQALAKDNPNGKVRCHDPETCSDPPGFYPCVNNENGNCSCFLNPKGGGTCGCNAFCSGLSACNTSHDCPKGWFCAINTCCTSPSPNVCIAKCIGKHKNCQLDHTHAGQTAKGLIVL